ncbi:hypothetical protein IKI14_07395 [bacterium]|nr:hypothetical protein [bacterium]
MSKNLYTQSGRNVDTHRKIPMNKPNKFFTENHSFIIKTILLMVTKVKVIRAIGSRIIEKLDIEPMDFVIVS